MRSPIPANISRALKKIPQLSASEERDLFAKFRGGDKWASELLILSQLKFVISIARNYRRDGCPLPDLIQEGTVGLLEAMKRFNPDRGTRLSTFAMWWIRAAVQDHVVKTSSVVRTVTTPQARNMFFSPAIRSLDLNNETALRSAAARFRTTSEEVRSFVHRTMARVHNIDTSNLGDYVSQSLEDSAANPETVLVDKQEKLKLMRLLRTAIPRMTKRERHILRRRFLGTKQTSRNKIGRELGVSKERVRQLEIRALDKLRSIAAVSQTAE